MLNLRNCILLYACVFFQLSCSNNQFKRIKEGNLFAEGNFIDGKIMEGKISYYDSLNVLANVSTYQKGIKNGISINYFPNGRVSDSVEFRNGKELGYRKFYDSEGKDIYGEYYYYGLKFGPEWIFKDGKVEKFFFTDFDRNRIVACSYNSERMDTLELFNMAFSIKQVDFKGKRQYNLFGYFPVIPYARQKFTLGLTNDIHQDKEIGRIFGHEFLLDTLLPPPPTGWHYYVACVLKANNDSINKVYIAELMNEPFRPKPR